MDSLALFPIPIFFCIIYISLYRIQKSQGTAQIARELHPLLKEDFCLGMMVKMVVLHIQKP